MKTRIIRGDCRQILPSLEASSIQTCITSPPYWKKREYGGGGIGTERSIETYIYTLRAVFDKVWDVLAKDGILWVNIADTYITSRTPNDEKIKEKNLALIPDRFAIAMQQRGWFVRQRLIWHKTNTTPESITDRFCSSHEYIFMLTRSAKYYFNQDAIEEMAAAKTPGKSALRHQGQTRKPSGKANREGREFSAYHWRIMRDVISLATKENKNGHTAAYPVELPHLLIKASTTHKQTVLDPFSGSGTTGAAAVSLGRDYIGIELCDEQAARSKNRLEKDAPIWYSHELHVV